MGNGKSKGEGDKDKNDNTEKDGEKEKKTEAEVPKHPPIPFTQMFRYATGMDKLLIFIGVVAAGLSGCTMPAMIIIFGRIADAMVDSTGIDFCSDDPGQITEPDLDKVVKVIGELSLIQSCIGVGQLIVGYFFITCFNRVSENMVFKLRQKYLESLLRQNVGWYDTNQDRNFVSRITEDGLKLQEATGEKVGLCVFFMSTSVLSIVNAFVHGWLLTLVVLCSAPALAIATGLVMSIQSKLAASEQTAYAKAGSTAEEVLTNIRTVMAFTGQDKELKRYEEGLDSARKAGTKRGIVSALGMGLVWLIMYCSYALAFWYGTKLILDGRVKQCDTGEEPAYTAQNMLIVFFSVIMGAFNIGQASSYFEAFAVGRGAGANIYAVIDRVPEIDSYSESGVKGEGRLKGNIEFKDVVFHYPSRPEVKILNNFSLSIKPGQTVALVGHSGCGKSTCLQLLQRFYDPDGGDVTVDGVSIKDYHLGWFRSQIGIVSQEPVLFNGTIAENIAYGRDGVTQEEIEKACINANAHGFISKLPKGYQTQVGERGAQLSGGQKQRVAIARALVRDPAVLLLDEATSALDTQSESVVQRALDKAREGRTTIIVAHRLSTIRAADVVVGVNEGKVAEKGTHEELLELKGLYHALVTAQSGIDPTEETDGGDDRRDSQVSSVDNALHDEDVLHVETFTAEEDADENLGKEAPLMRLMKMNMPEWPWMVFGVICSIVQGCALPIYAIIFGDFLQTLSSPKVDEARSAANKYAVYFLLIGVAAGVSVFFQLLSFSVAGEALTSRLRRLAFKAMMRQECAWYDKSSNSVGSLSAKLSGDAASVQGATGSRIGTVVQSISTIVFAIILAMNYQWKLGLVATAFVPLVAIPTYFEGQLLGDQNLKEKKAVEESSKVAVQAVGNIRTVASLCKEKKFTEMYRDVLVKPHNYILRRAHFRGFIFGFSQSMPLFAYSVVMYYGATLIKAKKVEYGDVFKVAEALIFGSMMVANTLAFAPNYNKAIISGARILRLLDRKPAIDDSPSVGLQLSHAEGSIRFQNVAFNYPSRPTAKILKDLSLGVAPGKSVALVGPSGSGKSTCVQLILRFYDPLSGEVFVEETDVAAVNVNSLRSHMAIVAQEPALFDRTIAENIAYGDNFKEVLMDQIIDAARMANIHEFVSNLPAGYETRVGEMGTQLSGGQKQRVAIARSLVRNPKILLLDEATSALDMESEQVVQAALDAASSGRTSITIAHRLASIQNVDEILVVNNGEVVEHGTHKELLQKRGLYSQLWRMQGGGHSHGKD